MSTTRQRVEVYWGDQPPGIEEMAPPAPTGEMIFDPADVGMLGRASGSREAGILPGIGKASAVHGNDVAAIASATGQSESSVDGSLGNLAMPMVGGDGGFDARSNRIAHHTHLLQQNRVIKSSTGPWSAFNFGDMSGNVDYSYGGDDEGGAGEGGAGEGETRPDIALPPHVGTTGKNTKLYEIMMLTNLDQEGIRLWAEAHGLSYEDAIDQLFAEFVPTEWKSPWEQHLETSGFAEGTSLEEAWAQIGAGGEDGVVQLYQGEEGEGTRAHYEHDLSEGLTQLSFGEWANQRYHMGQFEDGSYIAPIDEAGADAWNQELDEIMGDTVADTGLTEEEYWEEQSKTKDDQEEIAYEDPFGRGQSWETEKDVMQYDDEGNPIGTAGELFGGDRERWERERAEAKRHADYIEQVSNEGPAITVSPPQEEPISREEEEAYEHGLTGEEWKRSWEGQEEKRKAEEQKQGIYEHGLTEDEWAVSWDNPEYVRSLQ